MCSKKRVLAKFFALLAGLDEDGLRVLLEQGPDAARVWAVDRAQVNSTPSVSRGLGGWQEPGAARDKWTQILLAHPEGRLLGSRGVLPRTGTTTPGVLYSLHSDSRQTAAVAANDLREAALLLAWEPGQWRGEALWVEGGLEVLRAASPMLSAPSSALKSGRPKRVRTREEVRGLPTEKAGINRIHRGVGTAEHEVYVGQSIDVGARLLSSAHKTVQNWGWGPGGITFIEVIFVKAAIDGPGWCQVDLDQAEEQHISKFRTKQELFGTPVLANVTRGSNGYKRLRQAPHRIIWSSEVETEYARDTADTPPTRRTSGRRCCGPRQRTAPPQVR